MSLFITIFDVIWLLALLVLLVLIWRSSEERLKHVQRMEVTLFEVSKTSAKSAQQAAEAAQLAVEMLQKEREK